jgi:anti-sigma-K factor RskA
VNLQEYIASGILELYALGELSEQERSEVEQNLARYPELRTELARVEETQEKLLMQAAVQPRAAVKTALFDKIDAQKTAARVVPMPEAKPTAGRFWKFAAAACFTLAIVSSYLAYEYHNRWKSTETNYTELLAQNQRMAQDYNRVNQRIDKIEGDLRVIDDPAFKRVVMKGTDNAPNATAYVYWNEASDEVYLSIQSMKALARDNQYQLWAIVDGKPVDAGVFDGNGKDLLKMKNIAGGAAAFAVTIEPRGGKESPTLSTMQVVGNVVKG